MRLYKVSDVVRDAQIAKGKAGETDRLHYCYRCYDCRRLITKLEIIEAQSNGRPNLCPCGSAKVRVTNAKPWEELLLPRVWKLIFAIYTKKIAPPPTPMSAEEQAESDRMARASMRAYERQMLQELDIKRSRQA